MNRFQEKTPGMQRTNTMKSDGGLSEVNVSLMPQEFLSEQSIIAINFQFLDLKVHLKQREI